MAETMKAWRINELGKPPVLEDVPFQNLDLAKS